LVSFRFVMEYSLLCVDGLSTQVEGPSHFIGSFDELSDTPPHLLSIHCIGAFYEANWLCNCHPCVTHPVAVSLSSLTINTNVTARTVYLSR